MTLASYISGSITGKWNLILTPPNTCRKYHVNHRQLLFNGNVVVKVNEQKHLGLILNSGLSFEKHLSEKNMKAKKNIGLIKYLSKFLPLITLDQSIKLLFIPS